MIFKDRSDATRCKDIKALNAIMPYLMRRRTDSVVYFSQDVNVENAMSYIGRKNDEDPKRNFSLFGLIMAAMLRTFVEKPALNRFIHRRAFYMHRDISFSFVAKKQMSEEAKEVTAKLVFSPKDTIHEVMSKYNQAVGVARSDIRMADEIETEILHRIPGGKAISSFLFRALDTINIAPPAMIRSDPFYTSMFFSNLGSIGIEAPFHHLFEWGTASTFVALGRVFRKDKVHEDGGLRKSRFINLKFTIDERIAEGLYFAHAIALLQRYIRNPEFLETSMPGQAGSAGMAVREEA